MCPLSGECLENETDRKLRLILSKAQHHQQQLSQQSDTTNVHGMNSSPATRRRLNQNRTSSPRRPSKLIIVDNKLDFRIIYFLYLNKTTTLIVIKYNQL